MAELRILIADDHALVRRGLHQLLSSRAGWSIVGEAADGAEAVAQAGQLQPDVAIVDFSMPLLDGPEVAAQIARLSPDTAVVVLTMHDSDEVIHEVLRSGARAFVRKTDADHELIAAVEAVSQKRHFFSPRITELVMEEYRGRHTTAAHAEVRQQRLTAREHQILQMLADGVTSKEVASRLSISVRTVESHRIHINRKLGFRSVADLVRYAIQHGLVRAN